MLLAGRRHRPSRGGVGLIRGGGIDHHHDPGVQIRKGGIECRFVSAPGHVGRDQLAGVGVDGKMRGGISGSSHPEEEGQDQDAISVMRAGMDDAKNERLDHRACSSRHRLHNNF